MSAHSVNQNSLVVTPQRIPEAVSVPSNLENIKGQRGLLDDLDPELIAKIMAEVIKKLKGSGSEKENKLFDRVMKRNPKAYDGKEDSVLLEE